MRGAAPLCAIQCAPVCPAWQSTFEDNAAGQDGGALGLFNAAPMVLRNTRFARNSANETGGAISAAVTTVTVQGSVSLSQPSPTQPRHARGWKEGRLLHTTHVQHHPPPPVAMACTTCLTPPKLLLPLWHRSWLQFVCSNNTAAFAGCAYVGTRATLAFVDGADGSASDVRGNTPHDIFVFRASNVTCGASGQPWAAPNNYTICGSACACNAAFVAGTSSDCPCSVSGARCPRTQACVGQRPARHASCACKRQAHLHPCPCA
jgi:predicted outer membrane repeat protein